MYAKFVSHQLLKLPSPNKLLKHLCVSLSRLYNKVPSSFPKNKNLFSHNSGGEIAKIKGLACSPVGAGESFFFWLLGVTWLVTT